MIIRYNEPLYHDEGIYFSEKGTDVVPEFILDFPDRGGVCLKKTGDRPLYSIIQANKVNCDLQSVLETVVHENQHAVVDITTVNDIIADFTIPSNLGELYSGMKRVEQAWYQMPIEVRESFGSDVRTFVREIGSENFYSKIKSGYDAFNSSLSNRSLRKNNDDHSIMNNDNVSVSVDNNVSNSQVVVKEIMKEDK